MNILALETSTEACSVALSVADGVIFSEFKITPRQHTYYVPLMMDSVLDQAGIQKSSINAVAYANGPGAFTGVRIATATAQGLAIGLGIPLIPISTLAVLAQQACDEFELKKVQVALDARMGQAYSAIYVKNTATALVELQGKEGLVNLKQLIHKSDFCSVGSGFSARRQAGHDDNLDMLKYEDVYPTASALAKLAGRTTEAQLLPVTDVATINYIRNRVAEKKKSR